MPGRTRDTLYLIATPRKVLLLTLAASLVAGCGSSVRLDPPTIPVPLIDTIPMSVAVRIPDQFENFVHEEQVLGREEWSIDLGRSNAKFFTQLFGYMFDQVTIISEADEIPSSGIDALIEPTIDAFEFSVPNQTKTDSFSVWIRYRIKVYDSEGELIANWPVSAYGKSLTTAMGGSDALQRAAVLALRDAAALLIIKFDDQVLVSSLGDSEEKAAIETDQPASDTAQATNFVRSQK